MVDSDGQMTVISSRSPTPNSALERTAPPLESAGLLEGEYLGQFQLEKFVGGGGMGVVFRALDTTLNREVAVKVLARDQSADEETLRRFRNEAQSAARLNHENIARVHYVGEDRGLHYIVFEYIEGINIRDLVAQGGPLPLEDALSYTFQIAQALEHASQRSVIHRDIKPSNVLITYDGKAKLVDMGLARLNQMSAADNDLTASGVTLGTFDYISPEQARDPRSADVRSDLYSLGCSFFFMLAGRPPFPEGTVLQKLLQHQGDEPPDPRMVRPELPTEVTRILAKLLAKSPAHRYQQPGELIAELSHLGESLGIQLHASRPHWTPPREASPLGTWQQHLPWAVPLAALFIVVLALDFYWSNDPNEALELTALGRGTQQRTTVPPAVAPDRARSASNSSPAVDPRAGSQANETANPPQPATSLPEAGQPKQAASTREDAQKFFERVLEPFSAKRTPAGARPLRPSDMNDPAGTARDAGSSQARRDIVALPPVPDNVLVVGDDKAPRHYASLYAACSDAKTGDIVELRFSGRRVEKPITIANTRLTIRAGDGFQPVVVFHPEPELVPLKYPTTMISITGGQLQVTGVHWELDLPRGVPPEWALVETRNADLAQFTDCTFTVRNASLGQSAYHPGVAFFEIKASPGAGNMAADALVSEQQIVTLNLRNCVARGEAVFLRANELQPARLTWENGLLATSERLLVSTGGPSQARQVGALQINLRHVTAVVQSGLALLTNSEDSPYMLVTEISCDDCILATSGAAPLVEQRGSDSIEEFLTRFQWSGSRDFFVGFDVFWRIIDTTGEPDSRDIPFVDWLGRWGASSRWQVVAQSPLWKHAAAHTQAYHAQMPLDFVVDSSGAGNQAVGAASDGLDAGGVIAQLPVPATMTAAMPDPAPASRTAPPAILERP
jgi:serine/threonine-protein kinase